MKSIVAALLLAGLQGLSPLVGPLVPDSTGTITGVVRRAFTGQPIAEAQVALVSRSDSSETARAIPTDLNGKFMIKGVTPGQYVVVVQIEGYFSLNGETPSSTSTRRDIFVNEGQQTDAGTLELIPGAAISGRIAAPDGQPLTGAAVQALRASYIRGRLAFTLVKTVTTNDLGEYRLFWLPPGEYYIRSQYRTTTKDHPERYERMFFPGIPDEDAASPIGVSADAEVSGIDIRVPVAPINGFTLSGRVTRVENGPELRVTSVYAVPRNRRVILAEDDADSFPNEAADLSNGMFEIRNVLPGDYNLYPVTRDGDGNLRMPSIPVEVVGRDIQNLSSNLEPDIDLKGRVLLDGGKLDDRVRSEDPILLVSLEDLPGQGRAKTFRIHPDPKTDEFVVPRLAPGRYAVQWSSFRVPDVYVAEVKIGKDSVLDRGFTVGGESRGPLDVMLKSTGGSVAGVVLDSSRLRPSRYSTIVLVPEPSRRQNFALFKHVISEDGNFDFRGIPSGDYRLFAWTSVASGAWENALFLQRFDDRGVAVSVTEGSSQKLQLTVIP